jgi:hypothetical protein
MERVLYVVSREQPLLSGYLLTTMGSRSSDERRVEIKVDERRTERRLSGEARDPERRRQGERRRRPSLEPDLRDRGYAAVILEDSPSRAGEVPPAPAMVWRPRSSWRHRAARVARRRLVRWGLIVVLLAAIGVSIVVARSMPRTPAPPSSGPSPSAPPAAGRSSAAPSSGAPSASIPPVAPRIATPAPAPPIARTETVVPAPPPPPSRPAPARIVTTRSTGVVLSVDPRARMLVLEDRGAAGETGRLHIELAPDARVALSERNDRVEDLSRPFKDTAIDLSDLRRGDYVVVIRQGPEGKELARSVVVTFRPTK